MTERVTVFIDYQNVHLTARGLYQPQGSPPQDSIVHPVRIGERIVANRRFPSDLHQVLVFRGRPNPAHHPKPTAANDAQTAAWERDGRVEVVRRDLNYRGWPTERPREKGVDVALAVRLVECALAEESDVLVVFSADTDILPAVEMAYYKTTPRVEIASWAGAKPLWFPRELRAGRKMPFCHFLSEDDFNRCRDLTPYV
jgi:hypothetical protein